MKTKHTPGPWHIQYEAMVFAGKRTVANCAGYQSNVNSTEIRNENNANARLIAAAPDLLEACEDMFCSLAAFMDYSSERYYDSGSALEKGRNAIRKATEATDED